MIGCRQMSSRVELPVSDLVAGSTLTLVDEPCFSFGYTDNVRRYQREYLLGETRHSRSVHGILLNQTPLAVFGAAGGCSGVHARSGVIVSGRLYLAVGDHLACFDPQVQDLVWARQVDEATCFGVYCGERENAIFCHGELTVSRLDRQGNLVWSASGADIFTGEFVLDSAGVHVRDFNGRKYSFSLDEGREIRSDS